MARVHNFSAGPAALPTSVLAEIADEMMDYRGCGMSVLEMSHRSSMYQQIIDDAEATLRRLLSIPDNYCVLFLQGGATLQFAGIPMNLMRRGRAGYIVTGNFANKAYKEAAKYGEAVPLASSEDTNFDRIPNMADISARIAAEAAGKSASVEDFTRAATQLFDASAVEEAAAEKAARKKALFFGRSISCLVLHGSTLQELRIILLKPILFIINDPLAPK